MRTAALVVDLCLVLNVVLVLHGVPLLLLVLLPEVVVQCLEVGVNGVEVVAPCPARRAGNRPLMLCR